MLGRSSTEFAQATTNFSSKLARLLSEVSFLVGEKSAVRSELYIHVNGVSNIGKYKIREIEGGGSVNKVLT